MEGKWLSTFLFVLFVVVCVESREYRRGDRVDSVGFTVPSILWVSSPSSSSAPTSANTNSLEQWTRPVEQSKVMRCFGRILEGQDCQFLSSPGKWSGSKSNLAVIVVHDDLTTEDFFIRSNAYSATPNGGDFRYLKNEIDSARVSLSFPLTLDASEQLCSIFNIAKTIVEKKENSFVVVGSTKQSSDDLRKGIWSIKSLNEMLVSTNFAEFSMSVVVILAGSSSDDMKAVESAIEIIRSQSSASQHFVGLSTSQLSIANPLYDTSLTTMWKDDKNGSVPSYNGDMYKTYWPPALINAYWIIFVFGLMFFWGLRRMVIMQSPSEFQPFVEGARFCGGSAGRR